MSIKVVCSKCGTACIMGRTATGDPVVCDRCAGVERDAHGYAWFPGELSKTFESVATGREHTLSRDQAFKQQSPDKRKNRNQ